MDLNFILNERTFAISGYFSNLSQTLISQLTQYGADIALLGPDADRAEKFCQQISDQNEVNSKFGKAVAIKVNLNNSKEVQEGLTKVAQSFGGIDGLIDANFMNVSTPFLSEDKSSSKTEEIVRLNLINSLDLTQIALEYLKGRKRGRIVYLLPASAKNNLGLDIVGSSARMALKHFASAMAPVIKQKQITINCIELGYTEEYLTGHFPQLSIKEGLAELKKSVPEARLVDANRISETLVYCLSSLGAGMSGQSLSVE